jgi:hypothetical protein
LVQRNPPPARPPARRRRRRRRRRVRAYERTRELASFDIKYLIRSGKRIAKKQELAALNASGAKSVSHIADQNEHPEKFSWEDEIDTEWAEPYFDPKLWQYMPEFQTYSRISWFGKYNDTQQRDLRDRGANLTFAFALSTGHSGTTTLSLAESYDGFNSSHCEFGFEFLAQGTRDFARRHPAR